ncbi:MAG: hypothetical protein ABIF88_00815 [archaeon]
MLRKIKTPEEIAAKKKRDQILIGIIMVVILVLSTAGFSLMSSDRENASEVNENGYTFIRDGGQWKVNFNGNILGFNYLPSEVENVSIEGTFDLEQYSNQVIYFVGSGNVYEILNSLGAYIERYQSACLEGYSCEGDFPVKDCSSNLIVFDRGEVDNNWKNSDNKINDEEIKLYEDIDGGITGVFRRENCIFLTGDTLKSSDAFLYKVLKII